MKIFVPASVILAVAVGGTAHANPYLSHYVAARHLGGCKVEVSVVVHEGYGPPEVIRRARAGFALESEACSVAVGPLKEDEGAQRVSYRTYRLVDEVCGDGRWLYSGGSGVEVKGCVAPRPCPPMLEAPRMVSTEDLPAPACKTKTGYGNLTVGQTQSGIPPLGQLISGQGVVDIVTYVQGPGKSRSVRALMPGRAIFKMSGDGGDAESACAEFNVRPADSSPQARHAWAFRAFDLSHILEDRVIALKPREFWTLPLAGTLQFEPSESEVKLGVDAQCRPALEKRGGGWQGVLLTDGAGNGHAYLVGPP